MVEKKLFYNLLDRAVSGLKVTILTSALTDTSQLSGNCRSEVNMSVGVTYVIECDPSPVVGSHVVLSVSDENQAFQLTEVVVLSEGKFNLKEIIIIMLFISGE